MTRPSSLRTHDLLGRSRPKYAKDNLTVHTDPNTLRRVTKTPIRKASAYDSSSEPGLLTMKHSSTAVASMKPASARCTG